ncbi:uncharacterized protein LOC125145772 [Tachysurus fulvidraco]|uniref:uncharacterized protein LOC125145772 n=1 Tax=Tachysurus fulvidraco TaxID=1234273 RepID=UPI001FEE98B3|nr:uncharacterized protein LOC125145772 [Tachysurus fulvidraco]XP_047675955.1 uncharacterized protein LOC125145772 [Tachysurus fulvidraco]
MTCFSELGILCITTFLSLLSAADIPVSGHVGSTAVLPCELQTVDTETPYIRWTIDTETVFERRGKETYEGEGYEGRVDVPEEELRKGNCSLVLKHLKLTDTADYMSYEMRGTRRSNRLKRSNGLKRSNRLKRSETPKIKLISCVHLSVNELPPKEDRSITPVPSADTGMKCPHLLVMVLSFICLLIQNAAFQMFYSRGCQRGGPRDHIKCALQLASHMLR